MAEEMAYFCRNVWGIATLDGVKKDPKATLVGGRWVNCNKGDIQQPKVRARWVATEINHGNGESNYFAATPPLEAVRLLFSQFAMNAPQNPSLKISQMDIKKAYVYAVPSRSIYARCPRN